MYVTTPAHDVGMDQED